MLKGDPVMYEELTLEHKQKFDEIKALFEADLIRSFERTATTASGGRGSRPKALSMGWIYLSCWKSTPKPCAKKSITW
jgi:hypothetical protein